jgi:hypothetical protein
VSEIVRKIIPNPQGGLIFHSYQNVEPILEDNKRLMAVPRRSNRLHHSGLEVWYRVASIPNILLEQLWQQGLKFSDPDFVQRIKPMLNSEEYSHLRTAPGKL